MTALRGVFPGSGSVVAQNPAVFPRATRKHLLFFDGTLLCVHRRKAERIPESHFPYFWGLVVCGPPCSSPRMGVGVVRFMCDRTSVPPIQALMFS